ncbi:TonB-dependent receptor [Zhouia amylolytica]|uniref:TonB-dependent receptor n=1 Tax=Zhouia amylolytica TaxID=376730 RepID=UPI0020CE2AFF|nr:TonB-dependent receptor [Zhouia amylolytica]MCQ0110365.1 TonB-dependent receptor [Zhouia amylolytica]
MKEIVLAGLLALWFCEINAQVLKVKDAETLQPLEQVIVMSDSPKKYVYTNAKGQADISEFKGADIIEIRLLGYVTQSVSFLSLEQHGFELFMIPSDISLDQVVVAATRWGESKAKIPFKISTITPREVAIQNPQTAADLLGASGDVYIQKSQQGGGSPMIRGFSANRLMYAVDGVRMNTAIFRSGNLQNVISLDPFTMQNTEVLFGSGSVIYGSDAIGGVMSFHTLTPEFSLDEETLVSGKGIVRYASANDEKTAHFDINVGWDKWAIVTSVSSYDFGDLEMGAYGPGDYLRDFYVIRENNEDVVVTNDNPDKQVPSGYTQMNLMQKIRFKPNESWDFQYGFHYSETSDYARYDRHIRTRNGQPRSAEWSYGPQIWMMNNLTITNEAEQGIYDHMSLRIAHQHFEESRIDRDFNDVDRSTREERLNAISVNADFIKEFKNESKFLYGAELVFNDVNSTGQQENIETGAVSNGPSRYPDSQWWSYGIYGVYEYVVSEVLGLHAGMRYNQYVLDADFSNNMNYYPIPESNAYISNGALTGSLGLVYTPDDSWSLTAKLATAFRSPNVDDIGKVFDSEPGAVVVPNPDLKAEYAYTAEVGVSKIVDDKLRVDFSAYYTLLDDALVRRDFTMSGQDSIVYDGELSKVQAIQNGAQAEVYGVQLGLEAKLAKGFSLLSKLNLQKGEEELDNGEKSPSRHAAPFFGITKFTYHVNKLNMQLYTVYNGGRSYEDLPVGEQGKDYLYAKDDNGNPYAPAWYTLNFKATQQLSEVLALTAGLENITDRRYRPYSSGMAGAGRNFIVALRAAF